MADGVRSELDVTSVTGVVCSDQVPVNDVVRSKAVADTAADDDDDVVVVSVWMVVSIAEDVRSNCDIDCAVRSTRVEDMVTTDVASTCEEDSIPKVEYSSSVVISVAEVVGSVCRVEIANPCVDFPCGVDSLAEVLGSKRVVNSGTDVVRSKVACGCVVDSVNIVVVSKCVEISVTNVECPLSFEDFGYVVASTCVVVPVSSDAGSNCHVDAAFDEVCSKFDDTGSVVEADDVADSLIVDVGLDSVVGSVTESVIYTSVVVPSVDVFIISLPVPDDVISTVLLGACPGVNVGPSDNAADADEESG